MIKVPVIVSIDDRSEKKSIELHPDEVLNLDQELILDEDSVLISSLEVGSTRVKSAMVKDISTIWCKGLDPMGKVKVNVSIHKGPKTLSQVITLLPDEELFIGDIIRIGRDNVAIYKIKTHNKVVKYDGAMAGDIVRVYGRVIR
jgi:uncharacterized Zn finger protein